MRFALASTVVSLTCASEIQFNDETGLLQHSEVQLMQQKLSMAEKEKVVCQNPQGCHEVIGEHNKRSHHYNSHVSPDVFETHGGCYTHGHLRSGGELGGKSTAPSAEACQHACVHKSGCAHFVFFHADHHCQLHTDCSKIVPPGDQQVLAGPLSCHADWEPVPCGRKITGPTGGGTGGPGGGAGGVGGGGTTDTTPTTAAPTTAATFADSKVSSLEWKVFERLNEVRKQGFTCPTGGGCVKADGCGQRDLQFDCRLWWASKKHAEDMVNRNYYSHSTLSEDPAVAKQSLSLTVPEGGFTAAAQVLEWVGKFQRNASEFTTETMQARAARLGFGIRASVEILAFEGPQPADQGQYSDLPNDLTFGANKVVEQWLASQSHCMGIAQNENQLAGVGMVPCKEMPCVSGYVPTWQFMGLFTKQRPSASDKYMTDRGIQDEVPDQRCYPVN